MLTGEREISLLLNEMILGRVSVFWITSNYSKSIAIFDQNAVLNCPVLLGISMAQLVSSECFNLNPMSIVVSLEFCTLL